ncbi:glycosyltransferase family 2 protein [Flavivirga amylovorans]|uniref:Glycosyltransferase family 2 protein n=1 Tax=Flavivirga amylovorans TaxID=870486 RepID=A0ABT8X5Y5_9FLAO|nr:glycosyltransferase family 2 protein [Flavivirga amylovorans]MDO5989400.1 glycosyltransferase family 2 protein [Flavivirga amylovorans]
MIAISIVIINFNTCKLTVDCIKSVKEKTSTSLNYEIIVVDNCSQIEDYNALKESLKQYPDVKLVRSVINSGFSGGNMFGVQFAKGNYIAFLNSDTLLIDDCFSEMLNFMENNKEIGVCGPKQLSKDLKWKKSFDHFHGIRKQVFGKWFIELFSSKAAKRRTDYEQPIQVDFVQGSFMFFRSEAFAKVGGFDTNIFLYYEEMDICKRLLKNGYKTFHYPKVSFVHYEGESTSLGYTKKIEKMASYLYVLRKSFGFFKYLIIRYYLMIKFLIKGLFNFKHLKMFLVLVSLGAPLSHSIRKQQKISFNEAN